MKTQYQGINKLYTKIYQNYARKGKLENDSRQSKTKKDKIIEISLCPNGSESSCY